jgi:hypothetical protein
MTPQPRQPLDYRTRARERARLWDQRAAAAALPPSERPLTPSSHLVFRAGALAEALAARGEPEDANALARRDLRRYYWLLAVALESAPAIPAPLWERLQRRCAAALAEPTAMGDLSATVYAAVDVLPIGSAHGKDGWTAIQLLALADALERAVHQKGGVSGLGWLVELGEVKVSHRPPRRAVGGGEGSSQGGEGAG